MPSIPSWCLAAFLAAQAAPESAPEAVPGERPAVSAAACEAVGKALAGRSALAVPAFATEGSAAGARGLQDETLAALGGLGLTRLVTPAEVAARLATWPPGPQGLAELARGLEVDAALGATLIQSAQGTELALLLVGARGEVLLDTAFALPAPAPAAAPLAEAPAPASEEAEALRDPELAFARRKLTWVPGRGSSASPETWEIYQGPDERLSERELCRLGGRQDLVERVEAELSALTFRRDLGIGLTLAGVVVAGLSTPMLKADDDTWAHGGIGVLSVGLAAALGGAVVWILFGPEADAVDTPTPLRHLLRREEAQDLVRAHNDALRRELGLPAEPAGVTCRFEVGPLPGGAAAGLRLDF